MLEIREQRLVCQTSELQTAQFLFSDHPIGMVPFAELTIETASYDQTVQLESGVDRVPALVQHRAGGQVLRVQMLEQLADHFRWQIVDGGRFGWIDWGTHPAGTA